MRRRPRRPCRSGRRPIPRRRACAAAGQRRPRLGLERQQGSADRVAVEQPHRRERGLHRDRVRGAPEVGQEQRQPALVDRRRRVPVTGAGGRAQARPSRPGSRCERPTRRRRHRARGSAASRRRRRPGPRRRAAARADPGDLLEVAAGLLDRDDPRMFGQPQERGGVDVRARPRWHVVDDDRQVALVGDGPEVGLEHPTVRPVVVRRHDERRVGAERRRAPGGGDRRRRVVRAGAGDDRDAGTRRALGDDLDGRGR